MIYTDEKGRPIPKPEPEDYPTTVEFLRARAAWSDRLSDIANRAFSEAFSKGMKKRN